ncbi:hypothetical protein M0802_010795 [Mischocyttarus mexicanus]|nr:hypothetical protein M0802_010795 [Mischocyttarus mexicanus]
MSSSLRITKRSSLRRRQLYEAVQCRKIDLDSRYCQSQSDLVQGTPRTEAVYDLQCKTGEPRWATGDDYDNDDDDDQNEEDEKKKKKKKKMIRQSVISVPTFLPTLPLFARLRDKGQSGGDDVGGGGGDGGGGGGGGGGGRDRARKNKSCRVPRETKGVRVVPSTVLVACLVGYLLYTHERPRRTFYAQKAAAVEEEEEEEEEEVEEVEERSAGSLCRLREDN